MTVTSKFGIKYDELPESLQHGAMLYVENGVPPGGFLTAVFEDSLIETYRTADHWNSQVIPKIVHWLYMYCPTIARGKGVVSKWCEQGGLEGLVKSNDDQPG